MNFGKQLSTHVSNRRNIQTPDHYSGHPYIHLKFYGDTKRRYCHQKFPSANTEIQRWISEVEDPMIEVTREEPA